MAIAASETQNLNERRKPLALTNPLLAKESVLLPQPNVEDVTYEHLSLNLPSLATNALDVVSRIAVEKDSKETAEDGNVPTMDNDIPNIPSEEDIPALPDNTDTTHQNEEGIPAIRNDEDVPAVPNDEDVPEIPNDENENN